MKRKIVFSTARPYLLQQVNNQFVHYFLSQQNTRLFPFFAISQSLGLQAIFVTPLNLWI
jgi:hypothetical protein